MLAAMLTVLPSTDRAERLRNAEASRDVSRPMRKLFPRWAVRLAPLLLVALTACTKTFIPNTDVEDNNVNRKVITFCEQYRHAVEEKNIGQLLKLASPAYHKRGFASDDDVDYASLKEFLTTTFQSTDGIRYEIRYRKITFTESEHVYVDYTYAASYKIPGVKKEEWRHAVADNRLDLVPEGETYKIIAGM
jgi:hypothetical protein